MENDHENEERIQHNMTLCLHSFSNLSHVSPAVFVYLLKECYMHGTRKATPKFRILQQQVLQALYNSPQPGPATFVIHCLHLLPLYGSPYAEGFSHLLMSSLRRLQTVQRMPGDASKAKHPAAQLFLDILSCSIIHEERIVVKLLENFDIRLKDIAQVICGSAESSLDMAKACIERYIFKLIESQSYMTAVTLLEHFSIRSSGQSFMLRMLQDNQFKAAEKWATFMGKPMICVLVQKYIDLKMFKNAYDVIKQNNLRQEFPDACHLYKESSLKKLAEKGCWDVAEMKTNNDRQLVEYLVYLAMEAGYTEKVDELCERYSLKGFSDSWISIGKEGNVCSRHVLTLPISHITGPKASAPQTHYLNPSELIIEDIVWVDDVHGMLNATSHIEECKVVGMDCEWKPNYTKGSKPNKVSIMQIASERTVYILDLIKLSAEVSHVLDSCLKRILHSPRILKLGYNLQCDLQQLSHSYEELECFKYYEMLLDIQKLFNETRGGLSGLAKKILGAGLNKTRRNSNWEQRPLTQNQIEYAALDAAVLVHIFHHVRGQSQSTGLKGERAKVEWKSHIVSHMGKKKSPSKTSKKMEWRAKLADHPTL